jgi:hypothetical protein
MLRPGRPLLFLGHPVEKGASSLLVTVHTVLQVGLLVLLVRVLGGGKPHGPLTSCS